MCEVCEVWEDERENLQKKKSSAGVRIAACSLWKSDSRVSGLELPVLRGRRVLNPAKTALVLGPGAQVPGLDEETLRGVDIALCVDLLDTDLHAILGEDDILGLDLVVGGSRDLLHGEVELVGEDAHGDEDDEEDDEREEFAA